MYLTLGSDDFFSAGIETGAKSYSPSSHESELSVPEPEVDLFGWSVKEIPLWAVSGLGFGLGIELGCCDAAVAFRVPVGDAGGFELYKQEY